MSSRTYYVYILTNRHRTVLYTGVTNNLQRRLREHREGRASRFTARYNVTDLLFAERHTSARSAIQREKQIKRWRRDKKLFLIRTVNPDLRTLPPPVD
jgi:putative endonuclease